MGANETDKYIESDMTLFFPKCNCGNLLCSVSVPTLLEREREREADVRRERKGGDGYERNSINKVPREKGKTEENGSLPQDNG